MTIVIQHEYYHLSVNKDYFNKADPDRLVIGLNRSQVFPDDKYLRDSVVVTVHTRNIGSGI